MYGVYVIIHAGTVKDEEAIRGICSSRLCGEGDEKRQMDDGTAHAPLEEK